MAMEGILLVIGGQERGIEHFGEKEQVDIVAGNGIDKEFYLLQQILNAVKGTHLPLHRSYPDI
jgi:hypothetical protein